MAVFGKYGGRNLRFWFRNPQEGTSLRGTASFDVFCVKIGARVSAVAFLKNPPQKSSRVTRGAKSRMHRTETPKPIWIKFCMVVDIPDVVKYTNFGDHRLRGFWVSNKCIAVRKVAAPLRELTCHMGSHSVTCHPAEVTFPPLPPAEAGTRLSDPGGMQG